MSSVDYPSTLHWYECETALRSTHRRLFIAMGVAACFVSMSLAVLGYYVGLAVSGADSNTIGEQVLDVRITHKEADREAEIPENTEPPPEVVVSQNVAAAKIPSEPPQVVKQAVDWSNVIADSARTITNDRIRENEVRSSMWSRTHSVMFEPGEAFVAREPEPVLANFRFRPQVHVAGLGMTIGSCFIGIPVVGVPVEERSIAIRLFVCASDSS